MAGLKTLIPIAAVLVLGAPAYSAEEKAAPPQSDLQVKSLRELSEDNKTARWKNLMVGQLEDMEIVAAGGDKVGEVEEVLADGDGNIVAVSAEVGGFLGIADKEVVVSLDQFELRENRLVTSLTKEQLEALPGWDDD